MIPPSTCQPWQTDRSGPMPESTVTTPSYTTPWDTIQGGDTGRLLTLFDVRLQSVKKIGSGDVVVGISSSEAATRVATKQVDPNISHPLLQKDVLKKIGSLHGAVFNRYAFQAIVWKYQFKQKPHMYW